MQDAELLANYPPDNEQRLHQHGQIGKALDKLPDTRLEFDRPPQGRSCARWHAGRSRWQWPSTEVACDGLAAFEASDCVTSSRAPDDKAPPASSVLCRAHRCGPSC